MRYVHCITVSNKTLVNHQELLAYIRTVFLRLGRKKRAVLQHTAVCLDIQLPVHRTLTTSIIAHLHLQFDEISPLVDVHFLNIGNDK